MTDEMRDDNPAERGLVTVDKRFGSALMAEAERKRREGIQNAVVQEVQALIDAQVRERELLVCSQDNLKVLERKLGAIEAGEFDLDDYHTIVFKDLELNTMGIKSESCRACGAPVDRLPGKTRRK